ncbi:hypothetical protein GZL_00740 [Streptomyces sp. 769]|nr:hypothetical protein GZL_00740 [Streptomyces sp. 769]
MQWAWESPLFSAEPNATGEERIRVRQDAPRHAGRTASREKRKHG